MAYLILENGPQSGKRFPLDVETAVISRVGDKEIAVANCAALFDEFVRGVSRRHAEIVRKGGSYFLRDGYEGQPSRNGTFLNGRRIDAQLHPLKDGDRLAFCEPPLVQFTFWMQPQPPKSIEGTAPGESLPTVVVDDIPTDESSSTIMSQLEVTGGPGGGVQLAASPEARLSALIEITRNLGKALALDEVLPQVLNSLFKIFLQADRGFIVLRTPEGGLVPRWSKMRKVGHEETLRISRTIVNRVMESKQAILSQDLMKDAQIDMSQSIAELRIRSMMCAPLLDSEGNALGAIQLDTLDQRKRFQKEDLEVLASVAVQGGIAIDNAQLHERALRQMKIEHDLELAHEVQRALLPRAAPEIAGYEFFAFYRAANQIGGDYYDYIALRDGRMAVVAADVAGHGIASAMMMAKVSAEAKYCLATESDPAHAVTRLNDRLCSMQIDRFVTLVLVVLDPVKHEVIIVNAGHMPPIWRHGDGTMEELGVEISNLPLGILDHLTYDQQTVSLAASDVLALYTDGINEAMNPAGKQFTIGRIRWHVQRTAHGLPIEEIGNALVDDVRNHISSGPQEDDMCLVLLRRK